MTTLPEAVVVSMRGEATVTAVGSSCVIETLRVRSDEREDEGIEEEAGEEICSSISMEGEMASSTSIRPVSGAEFVPFPVAT
jgi:hypothetical protein